MNVRLVKPVTEVRGGAHIVTALRQLQADESASLIKPIYLHG